MPPAPSPGSPKTASVFSSRQPPRALPRRPSSICDTQAGSCAGAEQGQEAIEIASSAVFVNVASDGSSALFASEDALTGAEENEAGQVAETGQHNLYLWQEGTVSFVGRLDTADFNGFGGNQFQNLGTWADVLTAGSTHGRANSPTRSTPSGDVYLFQSHARLTTYDNEGLSEVYRYDAAAPPAGKLLCVSCDPSGVPPSADATLESVGGTFRHLQQKNTNP